MVENLDEQWRCWRCYMVADINNGIADGIEDDAFYFQNGDNIFFIATSGTNTGLWKLDLSGTPTLVINIPATFPFSLATVLP